MPVRSLKEFLDINSIRYRTISHSTVYTAQEIAASAHISGRELAKTVMVKLDGRMAMAVVPASERIDFLMLKQATEAEKVELATEQEFKDRFPGCTIGAMPPFGNLFGMEVIVAQTLTEDEEIAFNAGSHTELIRMTYEDFHRLVQPRVARFSAVRVRA